MKKYIAIVTGLIVVVVLFLVVRTMFGSKCYECGKTAGVKPATMYYRSSYFKWDKKTGLCKQCRERINGELGLMYQIDQYTANNGKGLWSSDNEITAFDNELKSYFAELDKKEKTRLIEPIYSTFKELILNQNNAESKILMKYTYKQKLAEGYSMGEAIQEAGESIRTFCERSVALNRKYCEGIKEVGALVSSYPEKK